MSHISSIPHNKERFIHMKAHNDKIITLIQKKSNCNKLKALKSALIAKCYNHKRYPPPLAVRAHKGSTVVVK